MIKEKQETTNKKILVFGDDNGSCTLYNLAQDEYDEIMERYARADDTKAGNILDELKDKEISLEDSPSFGYVPDYVVKLAEIYGFEIDSN